MPRVIKKRSETMRARQTRSDSKMVKQKLRATVKRLEITRRLVRVRDLPKRSDLRTEKQKHWATMTRWVRAMAIQTPKATEKAKQTQTARGMLKVKARDLPRRLG